MEQSLSSPSLQLTLDEKMVRYQWRHERHKAPFVVFVIADFGRELTVGNKGNILKLGPGWVPAARGPLFFHPELVNQRTTVNNFAKESPS